MGIEMKIRETFKSYLLGLGYTEAQIVASWQKVIQHCQEKQPLYLLQTITLEVMCRDMLEGREIDL